MSKCKDYGEELIVMEFKPKDFKQVIWYIENVYPKIRSYTYSPSYLGRVEADFHLKDGRVVNFITTLPDAKEDFEVFVDDEKIAGGEMPEYEIDVDEWNENESEVWQAVKQFEGEIAKIVVKVYPDDDAISYYGHMRDGGVDYLLPEPDFTISWYVDDDYDEEEEEAEEEV